MLDLHKHKTLTSCVQCNTVAKKIYKLQVWNKPNTRLLKIGYGLTVFNSLRRAKAFRKEHGSDQFPSWVIYSCEAIPTTTENNGPVCIGQIDNLFGLLSVLQRDRWNDKWPDGTILCSKVKLIKKVS